MKPVIFADLREEKSGIPQLLEKNGVRVKLVQMDVGDYSLPGDIIVERKTSSDFTSSILDGRLFDQAKRLSSVCKNPTMIIESALSDVFKHFENKSSIWGALAALSFSFKIHIFWTSDRSETAELLATLAKRSMKERKGVAIVRPKPRLETLAEKQLYVLSSVPGIGSKYAERLLSSLGTLKAVFSATPLELSRAADIPTAKALKIYEFFNARYEKSKAGGQSLLDKFDED